MQIIYEFFTRFYCFPKAFARLLPCKLQKFKVTVENPIESLIFAPTVHTALPVRSASQGVSFAFIEITFLQSRPISVDYNALMGFLC